jgi:tetratricopeptide (TPR) repeat protein/energy-coupling factor transporter ATP-binding protein EcfA2
MFAANYHKSGDYLVVKIDYSKKSAKDTFVGRDKEINEILEDLKNNESKKGTKLLLVGESGIGKSALLDELYRRLREQEEEDQGKRPFVGYYSKKESLIAESESSIYPFRVVLDSLVNNAKESQQLGEKIDGTVARVKKGLLKFGKEQGIKIGVAIIEDLAKKAGLEQTLDVGKDILKAIGSEKTSLMLARQYIADHTDEVRESYLEIFKAIANEFKDRSFVLIFDQFENVGKASTDFFLNFVKFLTPQERFHVIVSFRTDDTIWNDPSARKLYEDLEGKLTYDLDAKKMSIEGLSAEDIGEWIKLVRGISLPLVPDLLRIRENSAGLPLLLDEWIRTSEKLNDYEVINRNVLCSQIIRLEKGLDEQDQVRLYKMSILLQPLKHKKLARYLEIDDNADLVRPFIKRLIQNRIFDESFKWFRHELIQRCFKDDLDEDERISYHERAVKFFESWMGEKNQGKQAGELQRKDIDNISIEKAEEAERYTIAISYPYHLHMAGGKYREKSFVHNKILAEIASKMGNLDIAERSYKRAIDDAKHLGRIQDEKSCLLDMTTAAYDIWGRYEEALSNYQSLLEYYDKTNDSRMRARILNNMGLIHKDTGEYEEAMKLYNQSLEILKKLGYRQAIASSLNNIAIIHYEKGEYEEAMKLYNQSLEISKQLGDQLMIARISGNVAIIHKIKGEYEEAMKLYNQSLEISKQLGDYNAIERTLSNIANLHKIKGEYEEAMKLYNQSLEISKQLGDQLVIATTLNNVAELYMIKGEYEEALSNVLRAHVILERLKSPELRSSDDILDNMKDKLGTKAFGRLIEKYKGVHRLTT